MKTIIAAYLLFSAAGHAGGPTLSAGSSLVEMLPAGGDSRAALDRFWSNTVGKDSAVVAVSAQLSTQEDEILFDCEYYNLSTSECMTRLIAVNPRNAEAYLLRGRDKFQRKDFDGAIADYSAAIQLKHKLDLTYYLRGRAKADKKDLDGAIADYTLSIQINPTHNEAYLVRGFARQNKNDLDGAMADYTMVIQLYPEAKLAYFNRALIRYSKGDPNGAAADYTKVIQIDPKFQKAYLNRGIIKFRAGDINGAIADYDSAIGLNPNDNLAFAYRGDAKVKRNDFNGALADYAKALALDPKMVSVYYVRGNLKATLGDFDGAFADYAKAIELNPKMEYVYRVRGYLRYDLRSWTEALADFRKSAELIPSDAVPRWWIWLTRTRLGERESAAVELRQYMQSPLGQQSGPWSLKISAFLFDELSQEELMKAAASTNPRTNIDQKSEAYFFAGNKRLLAGDKAGAQDLLKACVLIGSKSSHYAKRAAAELIAMGIR